MFAPLRPIAQAVTLYATVFQKLQPVHYNPTLLEIRLHTEISRATVADHECGHEGDANSMLKAIIFDMDDTLIDWSQRTQNWQEYENNYLTRVFEYLMSKIESPATVDEFIVAVRQHTEKAWLASGPELHAPNFLAILEQAFASLGVNLKRLDIETRLRNFDWELSPGVGAYPDVEELLPVLVSHNIKIGMITNAHYPMWMRDRELQAYGLLAHFADCRLSSADVGFLKPHPAIFKAALDCLGARPDEAIFIGDNPEADIAGAQAVGMRGVLRVGPNAPPLDITGETHGAATTHSIS